ncbi:MAG: FAD-binding oxidoreductase [Sphingomonadales bacterium]|nr:FAD-binding oxidoreductase [Sphingomonadales bacterium]
MSKYAHRRKAGSPHVKSYYAATADKSLMFRVLEGETRVDVAVIGGGFTGLSAALHLSRRGYHVGLIEANLIGWGASGRSGGLLLGGFSGEEKFAKRHGQDLADVAWRMRWDGNEIVRGTVEEFGIECELKWGHIDAARKSKQAQGLAKRLAELEAHGFGEDVSLLGPDEMRETIGSDAFAGGLLNRRNGHLHPLKLAQGEARAAASLGVEIFEHSPAISVSKQRPYMIESLRGHLIADNIVVAGDAYLDTVRKVRGYVFPAASFMIATRPLDDATAARINPQDLSVRDTKHIVSYFRLSPDKRLLFGGRVNYSGRMIRDIPRVLMPRLKRIYPELASQRVDYAWGGRMGVTLNRIPHIGRMGDGIYCAQGYAGHGINMAHLAGRLLAEAMAGENERFDLFGKIRHAPLPGGKFFANPLMSLALFYYRLKDLL